MNNTTTKIIDREKFRDSFKYYDSYVVVEVMDLFLNDYAANLEELQKWIHRFDFNMLNHSAHSLKGVVAYFSTELSELCYKLELKGSENDGNGLQTIYDQLKEGILLMVEEIHELRAEYSAM